jgi:transcriptional regulator with XRE-family HTH domain
MTTNKKPSAKSILRAYLGPISFGEMLYSFRLTTNDTQVEMAKKLGICKQELCNIEKGRKLVSVERAKSFALALDMPPRTFAKYALQDQLTAAGIEGEVEIIDVA